VLVKSKCTFYYDFFGKFGKKTRLKSLLKQIFNFYLFYLFVPFLGVANKMHLDIFDSEKYLMRVIFNLVGHL